MPPIRTIVPQTAAGSAGGTESNGMSKSKSEESDAAQDGAIIGKPEKGDSTTKEEESKSAIVARTENPLTKAERTDHIPPTAKEEIGQTAKQEKVSTVNVVLKPEVVPTKEQKPGAISDMKPEVVLSEGKRADTIVESSRAEAKSNGLQRPNAEAVNC